MKRFPILLIIIMMLSAVLRLYRLDTVPPGVNRDEASIGFTAYSLAKTGNDEYGRKLPLSFESFGDWKLPLYMYLTIPFVKTFGLSELAVRLPSALFGIATIGALYYLALALFGSETTALLAALMLAIMPWHIHISRVESEAIVATFFVTLGSYLFLQAIRKKSLPNLVWSSLLFAATYYTYHGNHVTSTLLVLGMAAIYWKDIQKIPKWWIALGIGGVVTCIILSITLLGADRTKLSGIGIFGDPTIVHTKIELPRLEHTNPDSLFAKLIHNRIVYALQTVTQNYLRSYGPDFLFITGGGNSAHNIKGFGNLYPVEAPLMLLGVAFLLMAFAKKEARFVLLWVVIGGTAAAITKDAPHSNRMLMVVPALALMSSLGLTYGYSLLPKIAKPLAIGVLVACYLFFMGIYLDTYYLHFPRNEAANWGYAYKKLTPLLFSKQYSSYSVVMSHPEKSPYIYLLFYSGYDPMSYQKEATRYPISRDGFTDVSGFGRFSFRAIDWAKDTRAKHTLIVSDAAEVPGGLQEKAVATITLPNGIEQFTVVDTDK